VRILAMPAVKDMLTQQALDVVGSGPEEVMKSISADFPKMARIIKQLGIKPE
jgi:tripartite-type tricarboxylate transporter receptor subunit TctC